MNKMAFCTDTESNLCGGGEEEEGEKEVVVLLQPVLLTVHMGEAVCQRGCGGSTFNPWR